MYCGAMYPGVVSRATPTTKPNFPIVSEKRTPYVQPANESYCVISSPLGFSVIGAVSILVLPIVSKGAIVAGVQSSMPKLGVILLCAFPVALFVCAKAESEADAEFQSRLLSSLAAPASP